MAIINRETFLKWALFALIVAVYLWGQWYKVYFLAPPPANIWDNVVLWDWARGFVMGDFTAFENDSHHRLRWANWAFAAFIIQVFSDDVVNYFLSSIIPTLLASLIFAFFVFKYIGAWQTILFLILWYYDSELFFATFQLMPTGQSLLPIGLLLLLFTHAATNKNMSTVVSVCISLCVFWLYGVKETYLAFLPAFIWLMWKIEGRRPLQILGLVFAVGYLLETLFFSWISDGFPILGRIYAIANQGSHVQIMLSDPNYVAQQTRYFDSGITMRWATATGMSSTVYYASFLFALITVAQHKQTSAGGIKPEYVVATFLLSFMALTTFFIFPVYPIRLGHGLVSRYLGICLPFCYIISLWFVTKQIEGNKLWIKVAASSIVLFYIAPAINRFADYERSSIEKEAIYYRNVGKVINYHDCFRARSLMILSNQLNLVPFKFRDERINAMMKTKESIVESGWHKFKVDDTDCEYPYHFPRIANSRY